VTYLLGCQSRLAEHPSTPVGRQAGGQYRKQESELTQIFRWLVLTVPDAPSTNISRESKKNKKRQSIESVSSSSSQSIHLWCAVHKFFENGSCAVSDKSHNAFLMGMEMDWVIGGLIAFVVR